MACDTSSDEQRDSHAGDYRDLQAMRRKASLHEFNPEESEKFNRRAQALVNQYAAAITAVAERLLMSGTLDHAEVERIINCNPVNSNL